MNTGYSLGMNDLIKLVVDSTEKNGLALILTYDRARKIKTDIIANLILKGPLFVVSGDEWLPSYDLPRIIRTQTTDVKSVTGRLRTVRVSTCFRLLDALVNIPSEGEPLLIMDCMSSEHLGQREQFAKVRFPS